MRRLCDALHMKLAYSTNGFTQVDLPCAIERIGRHGYVGVELLADTPHWRPGMPIEPILAALKAAQLSVSNINANTAASLWPELPPEPVFEPSLSNHNLQVRAQRLAYSEACLHLAAAVGAPAISVTSGRTESGIPPAQGMDFFVESLTALCALAEPLGVRVGVEYEPGLLVETATELRGIIDRVDHPLIGANLDIGHAICAGEEPAAAIELLAGRIWNIHLEDIQGRKHYHLVPGEGDVDFNAVFAALDGIGYAGYVTVELYTCADRADDAAMRAHAVLSECLSAYLENIK